MERIVKTIKANNQNRKICIGGVPVNQAFYDKIGADSYNPDPQGGVEYSEHK